LINTRFWGELPILMKTEQGKMIPT
jgi:hypothetical protein